MEKRVKALLCLESGFSTYGYAFAGEGEVFGEVVFNTSIFGYQEIITDPSYAGQIVVLTYPHIGNYGANKEDKEREKPHLKSLIVRSYSRYYSNWRAEESLADFLNKENILGIEEVDTRALVLHIRQFGCLRGGISTIDLNKESLLEKVRLSPKIEEQDLVKEVTCSQIIELKRNGSPLIVVIDYGVKKSIIDKLLELEARVIIVPAFYSADQILSFRPEGILLSNGPGDPAVVEYGINCVKELISKGIPIFGICLGHQILALASNARTYKLKFGHHGGNHPVLCKSTGKIEITVQNHNFAVEEESAKESGFEITHINLNDSTVEGMSHRKLPIFSVQFHPEASPGPLDSTHIFKKFLSLIKELK
jgi:carbamoyl-phosphate synthase small subunit